MELLVNAVTAGIQHQPAVCTVNAETFAVSWTDEGTIKARIFGTNGQPFTGELIIKAATATERSELSAVAGKALGGFVAAWLDVPQGLAVGSLKARMFNATGDAIGPEITITGVDALVAFRPVIMSPLQNGGFAVAWASSNGDLLTQVFKRDGTSAAPPAKVNGNDRVLRGLAGTALTVTGGHAVAWTAAMPVNRKQLRVQMVNPDGTLDGAAVIVDEKTVPVEGELAITEEADGGFTVGWISRVGNAGVRIVHARRFDDLKRPRSSALFITNGDDDKDATQVAVRGVLPLGFATVWTEDTGTAAALTDINFRRVNSDGVFSPKIRVNETTADRQHSPALTALVGHLAFAWVDGSQKDDTDGLAVRAKVLRA